MKSLAPAHSLFVALSKTAKPVNLPQEGFKPVVEDFVLKRQTLPEGFKPVPSIRLMKLVVYHQALAFSREGLSFCGFDFDKSFCKIRGKEIIYGDRKSL